MCKPLNNVKMATCIKRPNQQLHNKGLWIWQETLSFIFTVTIFDMGIKSDSRHQNRPDPRLATDLFITLVIKNKNSVYTYKHTILNDSLSKSPNLYPTVSFFEVRNIHNKFYLMKVYLPRF